MFSNVPTARIDRPSIRSRPGENFWSGVTIAPASIAIVGVLFTPASEMTKHVAQIAVRFRQPLFGFLAIASGCAHNDGNFQVGSGCHDKLFGLIRFDTQYFFQDVLAPARAVSYSSS